MNNNNNIELKYRPLSYEEILNFTNNTIETLPLLKYTDLNDKKISQKYFDQLLLNKKTNGILLYFDKFISSAHWIILMKLNNYKKKTLYLFDSYGKMISDYLKKDERSYFFNILYNFLEKYNYDIFFNNIQLQNKNEKFATCGRWCSWFSCLSRINNDADILDKKQKHFKENCEKLKLNEDDVICEIINENMIDVLNSSDISDEEEDEIFECYI
jgi:hypothetical protein